MKNKNIIAALLGTMAAIAAYATATINTSPANVYYSIGGGIYILINCSTTGFFPCTPASVPAGYSYYAYNPPNFSPLPTGTALFKAE